MASSAPAHPLGPLDFAVTVVAALLGTALVVFSALTIFGSGSIAGVSADEVCATTRPGTVPYGGDGSSAGDRVLGLRPDASWYAEQVAVCLEEPPAHVIAAGSIRVASVSLFPLAALLLTRRLIRHARQTRLFSLGVAVRTRQLGWFLGGGSLLAAAVSSLVDGFVLSQAVREVTWTAGLSSLDLPWLMLVIAFGVVTVGRVLEWAIVVQEEVDATV